MKKTHKVIIFLYILLSVLLLLYSYTQTDLNLTLSRAGFVSSAQKAFQYIGYYQRPLSSLIYAFILVSFTALYLWIMAQIRRGRLVAKNVWHLIFCVCGIVTFSYPAAFSYDFFNYLFTAKTVLVYHKNPYVVTPLSFAGLDPWTNFMRWTHLPSAYAPLWIFLTLVPYILGLGYFVTVLFATKIFVASFYLLSTYMISKIMEKNTPQHQALAIAAFGLNPLIIIETLVSGHNDIVLVAFALVAVWYYQKGHMIAAWWYMGVSVAIKMMTIVLLPILLLRKNTTWMLIAMIVGLLLVVSQRDMLPWYWVWIVPFVAILSANRLLVYVSTIVSFGLLVSYVPYLYNGSYSQAVVDQGKWIVGATGVISVVFGIVSYGLGIGAGTRGKRV